MTTATFEIPEAALPVLEDPRRYNTLYGGRGSTKSWTIARILSLNGYHEPRLVLCGRETQKSLDDSVYALLLNQMDAIGLGGFYEEYKGGIIGKNGTRFMFKGLRNEDISKIKSIEGVDDCWLEEAQVLSNKSIRTIIPTIRKPGSRFYVTMNPELDDDPAYERFITNRDPAHSHAIMMNYHDNPWWDEGELEDERLYDYRNDSTPDKHMYKHIWLGHTLPAVTGAIFANQVARFLQERRFRAIDYDPMGKVFGIMDLGWGVATMVLAQRFATTVQIIGYREWRNKTYADITQELRNDPVTKDYRWGSIFMPHDSAHKDPKTGKSHFQVMEELGWDVQRVPQEGVENYIEKGGRLFRTCYINTDNGGDDLMRCLKRYKYQTYEGKENKRGAPEKDDFSHGAEAYCYTAVVADKMDNDDFDRDSLYKGFMSGYAG